MRNHKAIDPIGLKKIALINCEIPLNTPLKMVKYKGRIGYRLVKFSKKSVITELSRILNTCKTERGLGRAVANYVVKLKNNGK